MNQLDLHGLYHDQVWDVVENFVLLNSDTLPIKIITGLSEEMRKKTTEVLEFYDFSYEVPSYNPGQITVLEDKSLYHERQKN